MQDNITDISRNFHQVHCLHSRCIVLWPEMIQSVMKHYKVVCVNSHKSSKKAMAVYITTGLLETQVAKSVCTCIN